MFKIVVRAIAALSLAAIAAIPASAREIERTIVVQIAHGDLNLDSAAGMKELEGRVRAASRDLCGKPTVLGFYEQREHTRCMREFEAQVLPQLARLTGKPEILAMAGENRLRD